MLKDVSKVELGYAGGAMENSSYEKVSSGTMSGITGHEDYHQNYFKTNTSAPYCQIIVEPKVEKVRKRFAELIKNE